MRALMAALPLLIAGPSRAADLLERSYGQGDRPGLGPPFGAPRYFPRGDGSEGAPHRGLPPAPIRVGCVPRRAAVPTNAPDDPSYVGSTYGLSKPSYYGLTPPPGVDDPNGRSLLPYCP